MRRDFDTVLQRCGHDLDRAIADSAARPDYTPAERVRDLAGAVRWNAVLGVRERDHAPGWMSAQTTLAARSSGAVPRGWRAG